MSPFRRHFQLHSNNAIIRFLLPIDTIDYKFRLLQPAKQFMKKVLKFWRITQGAILCIRWCRSAGSWISPTGPWNTIATKDWYRVSKETAITAGSSMKKTQNELRILPAWKNAVWAFWKWKNIWIYACWEKPQFFQGKKCSPKTAGAPRFDSGTGRQCCLYWLETKLLWRSTFRQVPVCQQPDPHRSIKTKNRVSVM